MDGLYLWIDPFASLWFQMLLPRMLKPSCTWNKIATFMGTSCAEINPYLLMCAEGSRGVSSVSGAFGERSNLALLLIYAFPSTHNHFHHIVYHHTYNMIWYVLQLCSKLKLIMKLNHQLQQHHYPVSLNTMVISINKYNLKRFYFVRASPSNRLCYWFTPFTLCICTLKHYCPAVFNATTWFGSQFVPSQGAMVEPQWGEQLAKPIRGVCRTGQPDYYIRVTTIYYVLVCRHHLTIWQA